ncbi:hypothetical protein [Dyadobacter frigoris]|uniref:hypothetical protein n=1 Tax=Dyadobacter frigoris TaxID=2576211 RepID=UPI001E605310|nr:hypothetical protein [Dyadobacter frigoris]GLU56211.1 hypothetical protein Dfri01_56720 [Dyadobacter frigoris]
MNIAQLIKRTLRAGIFATALFCSSTLFAQVKIGTNPTTINTANNLEVESSTAGNKVIIDKTTGKVTIADGSQGAAKVLTSDANGVATWQSKKTTSSNIFSQTSGVGLYLPVSTTGYCGSPSCGTFLNLTGTFAITQATNDVIIDISGSYSASNNTLPVTFTYWLAITPPSGPTQNVGPFFITESGLLCSSGFINIKSFMKDAAIGNYSVAVYGAPWKNPSTGTWIGIGQYSNPGVCGDTYKTSLVLSVSE